MTSKMFRSFHGKQILKFLRFVEVTFRHRVHTFPPWRKGAKPMAECYGGMYLWRNDTIFVSWRTDDCFVDCARMATGRTSNENSRKLKLPSRTTAEDIQLKPSSCESGICQLCLKQSSRYTCPRCNTPYCSAACYKDPKHSDCSENFYKENFLEALKDSDVSHEDKRNMMEMLQRLEEDNLAEDSDDEDDDERRQSLAERLEGLDLDADTEVVWERLTEEEKADFAQILKSENLGLLVPSWQPWWTFHDRELVKMVEKEGYSPTEMSPSSSSDANQTPCPKAISFIPKLTDLLRNKEPSPLIVYDVVNVLFSFTFLMRFYNGEVKDFTEEMAQQLLQISEALSKNRNFRSLQEAIHSVLEGVSKVLKEASCNRIICLQDTTHILLGRSPSTPLEYIVGALSECWRWMSSAKKSLAKDPSSKPLEKNLFSCKKKIEFHLAWVTEFPDTFRIVAVEVQSIYKSALEEQTVQDKVKSSLDRRKLGAASSQLIEEIS